MLSRIGIHADVPPTLHEAKAMWPGQDGPNIVTNLRNNIVHPKDATKVLAISDTTKHDVVRLALWYVELALLRLLGHDGEYVNKTKPLGRPEELASLSHGLVAASVEYDASRSGRTFMSLNGAMT